MTLHELFLLTPTLAFAEYYVEYDKVKPELVDRAREQIAIQFDAMKARTPVPTNDVLLGACISASEERDYDVDLYHLVDVYAWKERGMVCHDTPENLAMKAEELDMAFPDMPQRYAFEFTEWNELLGTQVFLPNVKEGGELKFLACVFYEMTFFGFDEAEMLKKRDEVLESVREAEYHATLPPEEQAKYFIPAEEVCERLREEFGLEKQEESPEEKEAWLLQVRREMTDHTRARYKVLKAYAVALPERSL